AAGTLAGSAAEPGGRAGNVPAGTPRRPDPTCHVQGLGGIEPQTARRLACDAPALRAVVDPEMILLCQWHHTASTASTIRSPDPARLAR
ncbi:MAG: hypothetical protein L0H26_07175, partial [Microlunatus sp.]|nr:hypothetical protein [Microlunatus sp.]